MRLILFLTLALASCAALVPDSGHPERAYVVRIQVGEGQSASGVVIGPGRVVTAGHVAVVEELNVVARGRVIKAKRLRVNKEKDVALLAADVGCPCAEIGSKPGLDSAVVMVGYPLTDVLEGSQFAGDGTYQGEVGGFSVFNVNIAFGASGGGVFRDGKLVGVLTGVAGTQIPSFMGIPLSIPVWFVAFAVPAEDIRRIAS